MPRKSFSLYIMQLNHTNSALMLICNFLNTHYCLAREMVRVGKIKQYFPQRHRFCSSLDHIYMIILKKPYHYLFIWGMQCISRLRKVLFYALLSTFLKLLKYIYDPFKPNMSETIRYYLFIIFM